jgi:hypothetical protein
MNVDAGAYIIGSFTYNNLIDMTMVIFLGALPICAVLAFPFTKKVIWDKEWDDTKLFRKHSKERGKTTDEISYIDDIAEKMVLRSKKYPRKGSKEWVVSSESVEFHFMKKEMKNQMLDIPDMTEAELRLYRSVGDGYFLVRGNTIKTQLIAFDIAESINVAQKIYEHIAKRRPDIVSYVEK